MTDTLGTGLLSFVERLSLSRRLSLRGCGFARLVTERALLGGGYSPDGSRAMQASHFGFLSPKESCGPIHAAITLLLKT